MKTKSTEERGKLWREVKDNIGPKNSNSYDAKYMETRFCSDEDLSLRKKIDLYDGTIVIRSIFYNGDKYFPQVFLND